MTDRAPRIGFVSLGCPKALVDSERIITQLRAEGYEIAPDYSGSDLVVVNTCGFIDEAIEESLEAIGEALQENGKVIVTGCLGAKDNIVAETHPEVLAITGPHDTEAVMQHIHEYLPPAHDPYTSLIPGQGIRLTPRHYAYLKISEGCNHHCSFCIIPSLRGTLKSRSMTEVLQETDNLVQAGVREILVIAQDTSAYGVDVKYRPDIWKGEAVRTDIVNLCQQLGKTGAWIRLHYVYPYPHVDKLIPLMADGLVLPYLDVPLQHASPEVLKRMRRPANSENALERIRLWRDTCPDISLRSSFIVGFPGETDADFEQLIEFIKSARLNRTGCFRYSDVEGADSKTFANKLPPDVIEERYDIFMQTQAEISRQVLETKVGKQMDVIVDQVDEDRIIARSAGDAPEIDGNVIIENSSDDVVPGDILRVTISASDDYDLYVE